MRFLIQKGAQLNARNGEESVINVISKNVPRAMEEFGKRLDSGITMEKDKAIIDLDFTKIFDGGKMDEDTLQTSLFYDLSHTQFKDLIEHPLCQTFLKDKFNMVIWYFVFFIMVPHFVFSVIYSLYSGLIFGHLCPMNDTDSRWEMMEEIPCGRIDETKVKVSKVIITSVIIQLSGEDGLSGTDHAAPLPVHLSWQRVHHYENISMPGLLQKTGHLQEHRHHHLHRSGHLQRSDSLR